MFYFSPKVLFCTTYESLVVLSVRLFPLMVERIENNASQRISPTLTVNVKSNGRLYFEHHEFTLCKAIYQLVNNNRE